MFSEFLDQTPLLSLLAPRGERIRFPKAAQREAWRAVPPALRKEVVEAADEWQGKPYPMLTATQFLAFVRTGSRSACETPYFQRREKLMAAALGVCLGREEHLDSVIDGVWCLCEESFWGVSAHNGSEHPGVRPRAERPLPDTENPYVDLFAAQTAALLSWTAYLLEEALDGVSPLLIRRIRREVERRVLIPFFQRDDFWWMGMIRRDVNNWTPWILSNVMDCLTLWERDDRRLCEGLERAMRMLDAYLAVMGEDGGCDEGVAYWNRSGAALLDCLDCLSAVTGGRAAFFHEPKIRRIGAFPLHAHIGGAYFWNFADCDARPRLDGERVIRFGEKTGNPALRALGLRILRGGAPVLSGDTPELSRVLNRLFMPETGEAEGVPPEPAKADVTLSELGVCARARGRLYAAFKAGHNGENHNHNDVGTFLLYVDGEPAVIDLGNRVYTAQTFSPERYALPNTRSRNHNVPLIGEHEQLAGAARAARDVLWTGAGVAMDIRDAYPEAAGLLRLKREMGLTEGETLELTDDIRLREALPVTWVFLLREKPVWDAGTARSGRITLRYSPELTPGLEEFPALDERMARSFPGSVWRFALTAEPGRAHTQRFAFSLKG